MTTSIMKTDAETAVEIDTDSEEERYLKDRTLRARGFKRWLLEDADGDFASLKAAVEENPGDFPQKWDAAGWMAALGHDPDLIELLIRAETEWRVDMAARSGSERMLEVTTHPGLDFRTPHVHIRGCLFAKGEGTTACGRPVVPGTVRCDQHGGALVDQNTRRAVLMSIYLQLVDASMDAVIALRDIVNNGKNELARVGAAKEILDRAGLTPELNVNITLDQDGREARMERLSGRLETMREGLLSRVIDTTAIDSSMARADERFGPLPEEETSVPQPPSLPSSSEH